jgi:uncharacterized protein
MTAHDVGARPGEFPAIRHVLYLHGFASSPRSKKAAYFGERLRARGLALQCPDFNEPDFSTLTMSRMLDQVAAAIHRLGDGAVALIGSSLGAVVAIHIAGRMPDRVTRLVLLAPALTFANAGYDFLGSERMALWRSSGALDVFHFGYGDKRPLNYSFYEDTRSYDVFAVTLPQPVLIAQGLRDEAVDHRVVSAYAAARPHVSLMLLDDDHQLISSLPQIWVRAVPFLGLGS